ncbi:alginate lyase family protein [Mycobacterium sp. SMC-8]|uniref:heparinase II/III family protein n=1 Tax=Mycobacterium sp. SMC-8 TaxID=2857060 RepID=UPI0021B403D4|nr:alginate lyase family protein [Mycobacterium sp. SMC-8]
MSSLVWYAGRAARMSPREAVWRTRRLIDALTGRDGLREHPDAKMLSGTPVDWDDLREQFRRSASRPVLLDRERARRMAQTHPDAMQRLLAEAGRLLAGERTYLGYDTVNVGTAVDWNFDPNSGYRWPTAPGHRIDHRVAPSDAKWIWELNRLQHLPILSQAWLLTGVPNFAETALDHLDSWLDQNPVGTGIAWRGAFESGIRATSVGIALQGLRHSPAMTTRRYRRAVRMLDVSARYCWHARSRFSSANNHLIGEMSGLAAIHLLFPELSFPAALFRSALDTMAAEAERLILADGAGAEQSVTYQIFTAEMLATVVVLLRLGGHDVPAALPAALSRGANYLVSLVGSEDPDPRYGDDDDSFALRLGAEPKRTVRQHLGIVAATTGDQLIARHGENTVTAACFADALGTDISGTGARVGVAGALPSSYAADGGMVVLRSARRRLTVDVGPLGYLSTAAHGHADALSVTLSVEGRELIVDPGTGSFYGDPVVRSVHRGTRVHPTVCVDGIDQSQQGGPFFWRSHAQTTVHAVDLARGIVDAEHNGYLRIADPVRHRRWIIAPPGELTVAVVDLLDGRSEHDIAVAWPLHPDCEVAPTTCGHLVTREGAAVLSLHYAATVTLDCEQIRADSSSRLGWWSGRLENRTPAWLVGIRCRAAAPVAVVSLLRTGDCEDPLVPSIVRNGSALTVRWFDQCSERVLTIGTSRAGAVHGLPSSSSSSVLGLVGKS